MLQEQFIRRMQDRKGPDQLCGELIEVDVNAAYSLIQLGVRCYRSRMLVRGKSNSESD